MIRKHLQGSDALRRQLGEIIRRGKDHRPLRKEIAAIMHGEVEENFQAGGRDPEWPKSKRARKENGQTLIDTAQLVSSIQEFILGNTAGVGTNKVYAAIHNFGGTIERKPHSRTIRLRTDAKGNLLRQGTEGLKANLAVFATKKHKRSRDYFRFSMGYTIKMPQREFMKISPAGMGKIEEAAARFIIKT